jgi:hypothetical protein
MCVTGPSNQLDVDNRPSVGLGVTGPYATVGLGYAPIFSLRSALDDNERSRTILHTGFANVTVAGSQLSLTLGVSGSLGTQSFATLVLPVNDPTARPDPMVSRLDFIPTVQTVEVLTETSTLSLGYMWNHRWHSSASAGYTISGGRGEDAQRLIPQQKTVHADLGTDYAVSHVDRVSASVGVSQMHLSNGNEFIGMPVSGSWSHTFSATSSGQLNGGINATKSATGSLCEPGAPQLPGTVGPGMCTRVLSVYPTTGASFSDVLLRQQGLGVTLGLGMSLSPVVTSLTGELQERAQGTAGVTTTILEHTTITASFDGAGTFPPNDNEVRVLGAGVTFSHTLDKLVDVTAGYRSAWQESRDPRVGTLPRQWSAFLGLNVRAPAVAF